MANHLESLARRLEDDPFFLACTLKLYAQSESLDDHGLTTVLQCTEATLTSLRLCRTPNAARFREDVEQIVARFPMNRAALLQAIRRGQAILQLQRTQVGSQGTLLAARDGEQTTTDEFEGGVS